MPRISIPATIDAAPIASQPMLAAVANQLGMLPNAYRLMSISPQSLGGYLAVHKALGHGQLSVEARNSIALAIAEVNRCEYSLAEHIYMGRDVLKLDEDELEANRSGHSNDPRIDVVLAFATKVAISRGRVFEGDLTMVRAAGYTDEEIIEVISQIAINTWANYLTKVFDTKVDFPVIVDYERV